MNEPIDTTTVAVESAMEDSAQGKYPLVLAELSGYVAELLIREGIVQERARHIAFATAERVRNAWGGTTVYIPQGRSFEVQQMALDIAANWNGSNTEEFRRKYDISERRVRQLAALGRALRIARSQLTLSL